MRTMQWRARKAEKRSIFKLLCKSAGKNAAILLVMNYSWPRSIELPAPSTSLRTFWRKKKGKRKKSFHNEVQQPYSYHNNGQRGIHSCVIHQSTTMYLFLHTSIPAFVGKCSESLWSARWKKRTGTAEGVFAGFQGALGRRNLR